MKAKVEHRLAKQKQTLFLFRKKSWNLVGASLYMCERTCSLCWLSRRKWDNIQTSKCQSNGFCYCFAQFTWIVDLQRRRKNSTTILFLNSPGFMLMVTRTSLVDTHNFLNPLWSHRTVRTRLMNLFHLHFLILTFFFLWRGRKWTRLGPYNCVSCENLSEKDPKGPNMANPFTTKQKTENNHSDPQIPQPDLRFAANPTAKQQKNGAGPNKNTHTRIAIMILLLVNSIENQKHANELPCGRSAVKRSTTADKIP